MSVKNAKMIDKLGAMLMIFFVLEITMSSRWFLADMAHLRILNTSLVNAMSLLLATTTNKEEAAMVIKTEWKKSAHTKSQLKTPSTTTTTATP